jgi:hypothetical protein
MPGIELDASPFESFFSGAALSDIFSAWLVGGEYDVFCAPS